MTILKQKLCLLSYSENPGEGLKGTPAVIDGRFSFCDPKKDMARTGRHNGNQEESLFMADILDAWSLCHLH